MKLNLTGDLVSKTTLARHPTLDEESEKLLPYEKWTPAPGANYLVYDESREAPVGFGGSRATCA